MLDFDSVDEQEAVRDHRETKVEIPSALVLIVSASLPLMAYFLEVKFL